MRISKKNREIARRHDAHECRLLAILLLFFSCMLINIQAVAGETIRLQVDAGLPEVLIPFDVHEHQFLTARKVLRLGTTTRGYQPLELVRGETLRGITADYLAIIGTSLGLRVEVQTYPDWSMALAALRAGEVDVLGRGSTYEAQIAGLQISKPYVENQPVLIGRSGDLGAETMLSNARLAVVEGYTTLDQLRSRFPSAELDVFSTVRDALHAVEFQSDRWVVCDSVTAAYHLSQGELPNLRMRPLSDLHQQGYSFVFRADDELLKKLFNEVLDAIPRLVQADILAHWGVNSRFDSVRPSAFTAEQLKWLSSKPEVNVVVTGGTPPYGFFDDEGVFRGLDADLLSEISQRTGIRFKWVERSGLSGVLSALQERDADMTTTLVSGATKSEFLRFTDPYANSTFALIGPRNGTLRNVADLRGKRVALANNETVIKYLQDHELNITPVFTDSYLDALVSVTDGDADAAILLLPISRYMINQYFSRELRVVTSLPQIQANLSFAVIKDNPMLFGVMQASVDELEPNVVGNLIERWQNSLPAESRVWGVYERRLRWIFVGVCILLVLILIWQGIGYIFRSRSRAEKARQAFRSDLLDGIPQPVAVIDLLGRFVLCNHAFYTVFGLQPKEVVGRTWSEVSTLNSAFDKVPYEHYLELLQQNKSMDTQFVEMTIHGEHFSFRQWAVPHRGVEGRKTGLLIGWVDISATEQLLRQLQEVRDQAVQASEAKSRFLAVMSHEIRTPLNAIIGLLELTLSRVDRGGAWDRSAIEIAYSSSAALMVLIGDILDLAKIESGKLTLEPQRNSPQEVLKSVQRVFHGLASQKGLYLELTMQLDSEKDVWVDGSRLKQVLSNLLGNAIKYTDHGGVKLSLLTHEDADHLMMEFIIEDSGIGISTEDQQRLFQPFSQVQTQSFSRGGTGLGLVICKQLIEMMGGHLVLDSRTDRGTKVKVDLLAPALEQELAQSSALPVDPHQSGVLKILLVDDHLPNRLLLSQQLIFLGHSVCEAENGQQALECWMAESFDAVITDCNMPLMDGYDLARQIRKLEVELGNDPCMIIGYTANAQEEARLHCLASGMDECLFKPVSLGMLRNCIDRFALHQDIAPTMIPSDADSDELWPKIFDVDLLESLTNGNQELLRTLLGELYTSNHDDLCQFDSIFSAGKWRDLAQVVHRLKGAARMVGAQRLIAAARGYEDSVAKALGDHEAQSRAVEVRDAVDQLQTAITRWMGSSG